MKYTRKDKQTNKAFMLFISFFGISLLYLGFFKVHWAWNLLTIPIGLTAVISGYKSYKRTKLLIQEIEFDKDKVLVRFLNGSQKEVRNENLRYALLVKKFYKPIRSIELIEKRKSGLFRGKSLGMINLTKWDKNIEPIAVNLIQNGFERKKWKFGWSFADFFMLFAILFGISEGLAENYVGEVSANMSSLVFDSAILASDFQDGLRNKGENLEEKTINRLKKK